MESCGHASGHAPDIKEYADKHMDNGHVIMDSWTCLHKNYVDMCHLDMH